MGWEAVVAGACLAVPTSASAGVAEFFAAPDGEPSAACTETDPCDVATAISTAGTDQRVRLLGGTYAIPAAGLLIEDGKQVSPADPSDPVRIAGDPDVSPAIVVGFGGAKLSDVTIDLDDENPTPLFLGSQNSVGERLTVINSSPNITCLNYGILRDSTCLQRGQGGTAVGTPGFTGFGSGTLRNVTAVSDAGPALILGVGESSTIDYDVKNSILAGGAGSPDVRVTTESGSDGNVDIDYSNFDSIDVDQADDATVTISQPGSASNQTATPLFADASMGDFHQAQGSPTIDAGDSSASDLGSFDLDRAARVQGDSVDIGAYETAGPPDPDTTKPTVQITKGPAKKTRQRAATFRFTGSDDTGPVRFSCKLDGKQARPCSSPISYRNLKPGRHAFSLRVSDEAGNATTKRYVWNIVKKNRRG